jgi:hypothetical protein
MLAADVSRHVLEAEDVLACAVDLEAIDLRGGYFGFGL